MQDGRIDTKILVWNRSKGRRKVKTFYNEGTAGVDAGGETKRIPLTKGKETLVDACDYEYLVQFNWCLSGKYALRAPDKKGGKKILMHREILKPENGLYVDHISGDKLDNRRCNLRIATASQNACNKPKCARNKSGFKGVCWSRRRKKWQSCIYINRKQIVLGFYQNPEEAHQAYVAASILIHGEFSNTH